MPKTSTDPARAGRRLLLFLPALALAACGGAPSPRRAADAVAAPASLYSLAPGTPVDGTLSLILQRGQASARGTLVTNGQRFPVSVTGLSAQGTAAPRAEATARIYGLQHGRDFPGTYRIIGDDAGGEAGLIGGLRLGNDATLVLIVLQPRREGTVLAVESAGAAFTLGP